MSDIIILTQIEQLVEKGITKSDINDDLLQEIFNDYSDDNEYIPGLPYCANCGQQQEPFLIIQRTNFRIMFYCDYDCYMSYHGCSFHTEKGTEINFWINTNRGRKPSV